MLTQLSFVIEKIKQHNVKSVLNVGYRHDSDKNIQNFCLLNGVEWSVLEAFKGNCDHLKSHGHDYPIYNIDVRNIENINKKWDLIIWLHGPEHVFWNDFLEIKDKIENKSTIGIIYQAPVGEYPQNEMYGNTYEKHLSTLYPEMFENIGYNVENHINANENTFSAFKIFR